MNYVEKDDNFCLIRQLLGDKKLLDIIYDKILLSEKSVSFDGLELFIEQVCDNEGITLDYVWVIQNKKTKKLLVEKMFIDSNKADYFLFNKFRIRDESFCDPEFDNYKIKNIKPKDFMLYKLEDTIEFLEYEYGHGNGMNVLAENQKPKYENLVPIKRYEYNQLKKKNLITIKEGFLEVIGSTYSSELGLILPTIDK